MISFNQLKKNIINKINKLASGLTTKHKNLFHFTHKISQIYSQRVYEIFKNLKNSTITFTTSKYYEIFIHFRIIMKNKILF